MRDFRAKTTKKENREHAFNNVWVEGDLLVSRDKYYIHPRANAFQVNNELSKLIVLHEVIPETLGEYTGLTDKNGKKIFEGDIAVDGRGHYGKVFFANNCFLIEWTIKDYIKGKSVDDSFGCAEVVGNIYDNPELLEME